MATRDMIVSGWLLSVYSSGETSYLLHVKL